MFGDLGKMMRIAADVKRRMPEMQAMLEAAEFSADAGGGAVRATVNGKGRLLDVKITPQLLAEASADAAMLEDLIKAAVCGAQHQAAEAAVRAMHDLTGGMSLPGMEGMI
jgi:DNA-binding YbaB/EbfC family protein